MEGPNVPLIKNLVIKFLKHEIEVVEGRAHWDSKSLDMLLPTTNYHGDPEGEDDLEDCLPAGSESNSEPV